jgi:hypothetical protein
MVLYQQLERFIPQSEMMHDGINRRLGCFFSYASSGCCARRIAVEYGTDRSPSLSFLETTKLRVSWLANSACARVVSFGAF